MINGVLAEWIPPSEGTFLVRLTASDKAGNRSVKRRRVSWGLTPSMTNVTVSPRTFSPNGDGARDVLTVGYTVLEPVNLVFNIVNAQDVVIRTITRAHPTIGPASVMWDGRTEAGQIAADGEYRIRVLDYSFFVGLDNTAPDVRLAIGSSFRTAPNRTVCLPTPTGISCSEVAGPIVDTPEHRLTGRATDAGLATWTLEAGSGANPSEWLTLTEGADPLLARGAENQPIAPVQDTTIRTIADAREVVGKRFRLRAVDQAGNASVVVGDFAPQEIIVHAWDSRPVPTARILDQSRGVHVLAVEHTLRSPQSARVQFQREGSAVWADGPLQALSAAEFSVAWDNAALSAGQTYAVRIAARDADGVDYVSNQFRIHADLFEMTEIETNASTRQIRAHGVASLLDDLTSIRLVLALAGDPDIGIGSATFSDDVSFVIGVAPNPAMSSCASERVAARFKGTGDSGRVYYTDTFQVTRFGGSNETCTSTSLGATVTLTATRLVAGCGQPNPERVRITLEAQGFRPGGLALAMQDVPNGLLLPVPGVVTSPFEMEFDTSRLTAGEYRLQATARGPDDSNGVAATATASAIVVVDRAPPTGQITYPVANTAVCPARAGEQAIVAIEGVAEDANFDHYEIAYGVGEAPAQLTPIFPLTQSEIAHSRIARRGVLATWDVSRLPGGTYTLCLKVMDKGGNASCQFTTFALRGGASLGNVTAEPALFSPNGDGNRDGVAASFTLDAPALITARVFPVVNGQRADTPVRALLSNVQHLAGSNTVLWDGFVDLGGAAPDGTYHIVIAATDACGHAIDTFVAVEIDSTPPEAAISAPLAGNADRVLVEVRGAATDSHFLNYRLEAGAGATPSSWSLVAAGRAPVIDGLLGQWNNGGDAGAHTLRLTATDAAGNSREVLVAIVVQATQPLIVSASAQPLIFSPNGDGRADTTTIGYTLAAPARTVVEILSAGLVIATLRPDTEQPAGGHTVTWDGRAAGAPWSDGEYTVRLTAGSPVDSGHVQVESLIVKVDTTAPTVRVEAPGEGAYVRGDVPIIGTIADANIDIYEVRYGTTATGATIVLDEGTQDRSAHPFGTLLGLADGAYTIRVTATDLALNTTTIDRAIVIDDQSPAAAITAPETGVLVGGLTTVVAVRGSVLEQNLRDWTLRFGAGLSPAAWTALITQTTPPASDQLALWDTTGLADGPYTLSLIAHDRVGTASEVRTQIVVDRTAPRAVITVPADGAFISSVQPVRGTAADTHFSTATLEVSEGPAATAFEFARLVTLASEVSDGVLFDMPSLLADGVYTLRLTVHDAGGHRAETLSTFAIDTEPPAAPLNLVALLQNRRDAQLTWNATNETAAPGYHVYRGNERLTPTPVALAAYVDAGLTDGTHRYRVTVVDAAGLESAPSNEAAVTVDLSAPSVRIQSPANNSVIADLLDIRGTASSGDDFAEYRVLVRAGGATQFTVVRRSPVAVTSDLLAQFDTLGLAPGSPITVRLEAEDLLGNLAFDQISVTVDNELPATPVLLSVTVAGSTATATWQAVADTDVAGYLLFNNHLLANARRLVPGSLSPYLLPGPAYVDQSLVDGNHQYYVVAVDRAGNISASSNAIDVTVETRAPRATIVSPASGFRTDAPVILEASSADVDVAGTQFQFKAVADAVWIDLNGPDTTAPYTTMWDPRTVPIGTYQFRAVATDTHANVDAAPPVISIIHADVTPPPPPTALVARVSAGRVSLTWTASASADLAGYVVNRRLGAAAPAAVSGVLTTTAFDDVGVADGQYSYFVVARDTSANLSEGSGAVSARVHTLLLTTPSVCLAEPVLPVFGVGATAGAIVTLFADNGSGPVSIATTQAGASGAFEFAGVALVAGLNTLTAHAEDALGNRSKPSPPFAVTVSAPPAGVTALAAQVSGRDVTLTWVAAANANSYLVQRSDTQATTETTFTELAVPDGRHLYTVTARNACFVVGPPAQVEVEVGDVTAPAAPTNLQATANSADVSLQWTASADPDVAAYHVYRRSSEAEWTRITSNPLVATTHLDVRRPNGTHVYRVTALDSVGNESVPSNEASATTVDTTAPEPPVLKTPTDAAHPQTMQRRRPQLAVPPSRARASRCCETAWRWASPRRGWRSPSTTSSSIRIHRVPSPSMRRPEAWRGSSTNATASMRRPWPSQISTGARPATSTSQSGSPTRCSRMRARGWPTACTLATGCTASGSGISPAARLFAA